MKKIYEKDKTHGKKEHLKKRVKKKLLQKSFRGKYRKEDIGETVLEIFQTTIES